MIKTIYLSLFAAVALSAQAQQKTEQITVDGMQRSFVVYIPSATDKLGKLPVVIALHGRLGTGSQIMKSSKFEAIAEREKFIVICPDGIDRSWNDGRRTPANKQGINDVKFIDELITYAINNYYADSKRIYVTGMSNGGFMASRVACELSNRVAAVAVVAASMGQDMNFHPERQIPVMYIQGTKDPLVPFDGGIMRSTHAPVYSHAEILQLWAKADGCNDKPVITNYPDAAGDGTTIIKEVYNNPANNIEVIGFTVTNAGHNWPGGTERMLKLYTGTMSKNINATEEIWKFFKDYKLAQ